ncbi:hypothetical protein CDV36_012513 [Fusarium kuroshium]|uniref:DUF7730 domain-containing protein n=1 Tax=Fusarium kuroshium TaxID=2010991 RepID=A0A3M2RRF6_9HYPO|nr:hypothetical protein CDV36_012513 [Fusarium kuroshium]
MSFHSQSQSPFVAHLPPEVREAIYLELWRCVGLRQHIIAHTRYRHKKLSEIHLARWPCTTDFYVGDSLQDEVDALPKKLFHSSRRLKINIAYRRRGLSSWMNHWSCEERLLECVVEPWDSERYERDGELNEHDCWCDSKKQMEAKRKDSSALGSYMAMLLTCKLISSECLRSIYQSTTFIVTDSLAIQGLFGACNSHLILRTWRGFCEDRVKPPPAFHQYARHVEISLDRTYTLHNRCCWAMSERKKANKRLRVQQGVVCDDLKPVAHEPCDFHWLHLERFRNLTSLKIWISTRSSELYGGILIYPTGLERLNVEKLRTLLSGLANVESVVLSAPLSNDIEPDEGYVEGISKNGRLKVWNRGELINLMVKWSQKVGTVLR